MTIHYQGHGVTLHHGDCLDVLRTLPDASVDSVVTDPPYGLEFMGKEWDSFKATGSSSLMHSPKDEGREFTNASGHMWDNTKALPRFAAGAPFQRWCELWTAECLRVLKPGGHLLAFGGTRTWHRLACAVEDAGFEVRDSIAWLYGSGFPKSLDVSKAIDKAAGAEREVVGSRSGGFGAGSITSRTVQAAMGYRPTGEAYPSDESGTVPLTAPATDAAEQWQGWGTALKPAFEPVVVARKPLSGTVAATVLAHGTGALNIDGCRIGTEGGGTTCTNRDGRGDCIGHAPAPTSPRVGVRALDGGGMVRHGADTMGGRWPANVVLDESQAEALDEQSGTLTSGANPTRRGSDKFREAYGDFKGQAECDPARGADAGGASRFFFVASHDKGDTSALTGKGGRIESCETASTAAESSSPPRQFGDSALGGAVTSEHPDTASQTGSPSTSATPSGSRPSGRPATPTTRNIDAESSPEQQPGERTPTASPASSVGPSAPTVTTTTTTSPSTSAGSAAPATSDTTSQWKALGDTDSAPFKYVAKADATERPRVNGTAHPTVKPLSLMRWLVRLVTPPGGTVLEPFAGSGTTVEACIVEGFDCIAIEKGDEYLPLIMQRIHRRRDPVAAIRQTGDELGLFELDGEGA